MMIIILLLLFTFIIREIRKEMSIITPLILNFKQRPLRYFRTIILQQSHHKPSIRIRDLKLPPLNSHPHLILFIIHPEPAVQRLRGHPRQHPQRPEEDPEEAPGALRHPRHEHGREEAEHGHVAVAALALEGGEREGLGLGVEAAGAVEEGHPVVVLLAGSEDLAGIVDP